MKNVITTIVFLLHISFTLFSQTKFRVQLKEKQLDKMGSKFEGLDIPDKKFKAFKERFKAKNLKRPYSNARFFNHPLAKKLQKVMIFEVEEHTSIASALSNLKREGIFESAELYEEPLEVPLDLPNDYNLVPFGDWSLNFVNAETAWDYTTGDSQIRIAVIEPSSSWFKTDHEDLSSEIFYAHPGSNSTSGKITTHGTRVAGIAGARTNNNKGVASIGYNCKILTYSGNTFNNMLHAAYKGARVINLSFRSGCSPNSDHQDIIEILNDYGVVVVAASGNGSEGTHCDSSDGKSNGLVYPAAYDHVMSVGGTSSGYRFFDGNVNDDRHFTFNSDVDICAPGWKVTSTGASGTVGGSDSYRISSGTSFASPMVAATAGLILSINQDLKPEDVLSILKRSANRDVFDLDLYPDNAEYVSDAGAGLLDAGEAMRLASSAEAYDLQWINRTGVSVIEDKMTKTNTSNWWNSGAFSLNSIPANEAGWIEVIPESTSGHRMFGLSATDGGATWNTIDYNFYLSFSTIKIYHDGTSIGTFGTYKKGDVLRVEMSPVMQFPPTFPIDDFRVVRYYKNAEVLYSTSIPAFSSSVTYKADVCLYTPGSSLDKMSFSHGFSPINPGAAVSWVNKIGVSSSGNNLTKTNTNSWWNSGASSIQKINSGHNGYLTTRATETGAHNMIGLSPSDAGASWNTIKYNLYLMPNGLIKIYQMGSFVGDFGSYEQGDIFRIEREDGYIKFFRNEILLTGWEVTMDEQLVADVCMYTPGSKINNVRYADFGQGSTPGGAFPDDSSFPEPVILGDSLNSDYPVVNAFSSSSSLLNSTELAEVITEFIPADTASTTSNFDIFPNPILANELNIHSSNEVRQDVHISILDLDNGKVVHKIAVNPEDFQEKGTNTSSLDRLPPGRYVLSIESGGKIEKFHIYKE